LLEFALLDQLIFVTPAHASDNLFVGENGGALRTPVHAALLAIRESGFVEL